MRKRFAVLLLLSAAGGSLVAQTAGTPEARLALGITAYQAGDYASAVVDLQAAAEGVLSPERLQTSETALVYLALAQMRLGREEGAREALLRLHSAERIAPTYAALSFSAADAAEIETLAAALTPSNPLPRNTGEANERRRAPPANVSRNTDPIPVKKALAEEHAEYLRMLRSAETAIQAQRIEEAARLYTRIAAATAVPREILAEAGVGLYRTGAFHEAAQAFRRLGTFAKGEEDLRYYYAVALYETGSYHEALEELSCALPFIQVTDEVWRYRAKIENTASLTARK